MIALLNLGRTLPLLMASACCGLPLPSPPPVDPSEFAFVVVATREIPPGHDLTAQDVEVRWVPLPYVLDSQLRDTLTLPALRTTGPVHAGEALRQERLEPSPTGAPLSLARPDTAPGRPGEAAMFVAFLRRLPAGSTLTEDDLMLVEIDTASAAQLGCTDQTCERTYEQVVGCAVQEDVLEYSFLRRASLDPECPGRRPLPPR